MDLSNIDLNLLSRDELIEIIKKTESQSEKLQRLEDDGFFDYSIPDTNILESFDNISYDLSLEDALIENEDHDNSKDINYSEKQLKSIKSGVEEIKNTVFSEQFADFFNSKMKNIKNYLSKENYPHIHESTIKSWKDLYVENSYISNFYKSFLILQNENNVSEIIEFIKNNHKTGDYTKKDSAFSNCLKTQWFDGYKILASIDNNQALENVKVFLETFISDPDLDKNYKNDFVNTMFFSLYECNYHIPHLHDLKNVIFNQINLTDDNLDWGAMIKSIYDNITNMTHSSNFSNLKEVPQIVIDRMENEIFGFLGERGLLNEWFSLNNDLSETNDKNINNRDLYSFIRDIKNNSVKCTFNTLFNQLSQFENIKEYLLIKREKFIINAQLNIDNIDIDIKKAKRL